MLVSSGEMASNNLPRPRPLQPFAVCIYERGTGKASMGDELAAPTAEELNALLPQFRVEAELGRGGMGVVYRGIQLNLDRPVAIKLLAPHLAADPAFAERFAREARALARLSHPNNGTCTRVGTARPAPRSDGPLGCTLAVYARRACRSPCTATSVCPCRS